jgi:hypothetical protein
VTTRTPARAAAAERAPAPSRAGEAVTRGLVHQLRRGTVVVAVISGVLPAFVAS